MPTKTNNYQFVKPEENEFYDVNIPNANWDMIDAKLKTLETEVTETKKSVSDGKEAIAAAITLKKVAAAATDTFAQLAAKIGQIKTGSGNARPEDVVDGRTFASDNGEELTGTLAVKSGTTQAATPTMDATNSRLQMAIPATGKYDTAAKLYAAYATIASLIGLTAAKLWPGITILGIASSNTSMSGSTITPSTVTQTVSCSGKVVTSNVVVNPIPSNYYNANTQQTVFSYGSYGLAASLGAYYSNATGTTIYTNYPVAYHAGGGMALYSYKDANTPVRSSMIFRASFPKALKYVQIKVRSVYTVDNTLTVRALDASTKAILGYHELTWYGNSLQTKGTSTTFAGYVANATSSWFLTLSNSGNSHLPSGVDFGILEIKLSPTPF